MPSPYNPFFMTNLLGQAQASQDIAQGFIRGVTNETRRQSIPSQGLTNFVGYASLGFQDTAKDLGNYFVDQYKDFSRHANVGNSIPLDAGVLPMGDGAYVPATSNEIRAFNYVTNYPFNQQSAAQETGYQSTAPSRAGMLNQQAQPAMSQTLTTMEPPKRDAQKSKPTLSKEDADELSKIRLHSAVPSQNMFSISDASGNRGWAGVGDKVNGWSVKSYDKGFVTVEKNGVIARVGLQGSSPTEYVPPRQATEEGTMSNYDQQMMSSLVSDPTQELRIEGASPNELQKYKIQRDVYENIARNARLSPYMSDEDRSRIMHFEDYQKNLKNLESGKKYFVPRMDNNGNVDMDVFVPQ